MLGVAQAEQSATPVAVPDSGFSSRLLLEAIDDPAFVVADGIVRLANRPARDLLGEYIEGRDVRLAIRHPQALAHIMQHRSADVDAIGIVQLGRSWRLAIRELDHGAVLVRMTDRSDSVSAEKMRVDFVANASHELRTPLTTITGYAETIAEDGDLDEALRMKFGGTIRSEAQRMLRIIEDLMSLSRIEADRFVAPQGEVDAEDVVATAIHDVRQTGGGSVCEFEIDIADDVPLIRGDRAQIVQVLDNLIGNAVRYGCEGGPGKVGVSARRAAGYVRITVSDHGPGIPRDQLPRVTERFYRVDPARSRATGGTGLGLAIVKHIVERHRGTLEIASTVGVGTNVTVSLPIAG